MNEKDHKNSINVIFINSDDDSSDYSDLKTVINFSIDQYQKIYKINIDFNYKFFNKIVINNKNLLNVKLLNLVLSKIYKIKLNNFTLYRADLKTLLPNKWLNDKIINSYLNLIKLNYKDIYCFSSYFLYSKKKSSYDQVFNKNYKFIVFPIFSNSHWSLLIYKRNKLFYFDSLNIFKEKEILVIHNFLLKFNKNQKLKVISVKNIPLQKNGDDCGVFLCMYTKFIVYGYKFFKSNDINYLRFCMLDEIISNKIKFK